MAFCVEIRSDMYNHAGMDNVELYSNVYESINSSSIHSIFPIYFQTQISLPIFFLITVIPVVWVSSLTREAHEPDNGESFSSKSCTEALRKLTSSAKVILE